MAHRFLSFLRKTRPSLSVVVLCHEMERQLGNTLRSLSTPFQRLLGLDDYEILVIDNGSQSSLSRTVWDVAANIHYRYIPPAKARACPALALNEAVAQARADAVCVMIDGARMVTPATLYWGLRLSRLSSRAFVEIRGWHLSPTGRSELGELQDRQDADQGLLASIPWLENGYCLFENATPAASTRFGFFGRAFESNCVFLRKGFFESLGGFDERYQEPGGGLVNLDFFWRAAMAAEVVFAVLGEGTFHQAHGGAATGLTPAQFALSWKRWQAEYERLSRPWTGEPPPYEPVLTGHVPRECRRWLQPEAA